MFCFLSSGFPTIPVFKVNGVKLSQKRRRGKILYFELRDDSDKHMERVRVSETQNTVDYFPSTDE